MISTLSRSSIVICTLVLWFEPIKTGHVFDSGVLELVQIWSNESAVCYGVFSLLFNSTCCKILRQAHHGQINGSQLCQLLPSICYESEKARSYMDYMSL